MILDLSNDERLAVLDVLEAKHETLLDELDRMLDRPTYDSVKFAGINGFAALLDSVINKLNLH